MQNKSKDTLLLVGGDQSCRKELRSILQDSYNLLEAENATQAVLLLAQNADCIVLTLIDITDAGTLDMSGLKHTIRVGTEHEIPTVAVLDPATDPAGEEQAFLMGAADVILTPFSSTSVQRRIQTLADLILHKWSLEKMVTEQSETIRNTNQVMLDALSAIIEHRSTESGNHVLRIRRFTKILLEEVARCCPEYALTDTIIDIIASASALHDIGKISVPDAILNKPGKLTSEEFEVMKSHTTTGSQMVRQLAGMGEELYLRYAYNISLYHHERWDGRGYPCGLIGDEIPICAQVVGLTDAFDALTTKRVYKPAYPFQNAINMILNGECGTFSPKLLECFKHVRYSFVELARKYADGYSPKSDNITVPLPGPAWKHTSSNSLELFQAKYRTLLHYIDDTVLELDLDNDLYHVVYNPNPDLDSLIPNASFRVIVDTLRRSMLHPEDTEIPEEMYRFISKDFFLHNLRRRSFSLRIFSPATQSYQRYDLIFLRIDADTSARLVTCILHKADHIHAAAHPSPSALHTSPALYGLVSSALRCCNDAALTIDAGQSELFTLTGFSSQEIASLFNNQLTALVIPEDRPVLNAALRQAAQTGTKSELEFRLMRKQQSPVWVLSKCRLHVEENGMEYFYFAIRDNSQSKKILDQLRSDIKRNQILIDQSGSIVFDWNLRSDTMYCSPKWVEHFGYTPVSQNYGSQLGIATHFHPDDLILVRSCLEQIKAGASSASVDVRIANADGKYLWTKITAAGCRDDKHGLFRILGILQDIDELKRSTLALKEQAERDSLTKLLNKHSAQSAITTYLSERPPEAMAGLLVLDLDNFKSVNDTLGHLYGDVVLTQVGNTLRRFFRSYDIIGRIGGDEFLILLKDIPDQKLLLDRCDTLISTLRIQLSKLVPKLSVSCSIGAAVVPSHGTTYNELFQHADSALYSAKSLGKNQYRVYSNQEMYTAALDAKPRTTQIDSDDPAAMTSNSFERFVFRSLYESRDLNNTINELLSLVGNHFNVSRAYIFENNEDNTACSNTFEWCNEGITPELDNLQNVSYITDIPGWPSMYDEKNVVYCTDISQLAPQFRAILEPQGIKSMLHCAIMDQGVFRGYVGFDECTSNRLWTQDQLYQLEFLAEALSVFLIRQRDLERNNKK